MKRNRHAMWVLLAVLSAAAIGCGDDEPTAPPGTAQVRVVNGSADSPNFDLYVDGLRIAPDLTFREFTQYMIVSSGNRNVEARIANSNNVLFSKTETFAAGAEYTLIVTGPNASIGPWLLADDNSSPANGAIRVRLVHASPSAQNLDMFVTAPNVDLAAAVPRLTNAPFRSVSAYVELPAGQYQVRATQPGTQSIMVDTGTLNLMNGNVITTVVLDKPGGGGPFGSLVLEDRN